MLNRSGVAIVDEPHSYLIHRSQSCENFQTVKTMYVIDSPVFLLNKAFCIIFLNFVKNANEISKT